MAASGPGSADAARGSALKAPPSDGISAVAFAPAAGSDSLLVASWDATLSLHAAKAGTRLASWRQPAPVLDCAWQSSTTALCGGLDRAVRTVDCGAGDAAAVTLGYHEAAVRCVRWSATHNCAVSAGWDKTMRLWDPRASGQTGAVALPGKAFGMDVCHGGAGGGAADAVVVACEGRQLVTVDLRSPSSPAATQEAPLKHQLRCVAAMPQRPAGAAGWGTMGAPGIAVGSIEGRVALEYLDPAVTGAGGATTAGFAFKCHRRDAPDGGAVAHPVNAIAFNRRHGTFATGGGDGTVALWDGAAKKRLGKPSARYPTSVAALAFSHDSDLLAVAASYAFEAGDVEHPPDAVFVWTVADAEIQPKPKRK